MGAQTIPLRQRHASNNTGKSRSRGSALSLSDRITLSAAIGQLMAISGSFQTAPRSAARS
jgi:hypothetical protein